MTGILFILCFPFPGGFAQNPVNKFSDPVIRRIHDLADQRDSLALLPFLRDSNPNYQGEALMCFGSVQAGSLVDSIAPSLESEFDGIRMAAAFALGQTFNAGAAPHLVKALENDTVKLVRGMLFDALGKTGVESDLLWLAGQAADYQEAEGQAQGILRFASRGISRPEGNARMLKIITEGTSTVGLIYATYHLGRYTDTLWLTENLKELEELYRDEWDPIVSSNMVMAMIKGRQEHAWPQVEVILKSDADYREKVNAIKSVNQAAWEDASSLLYKITADENPNLAVAAAELISLRAGEGNLQNHLKAINKVKNWRARALLLGKALEIAPWRKGQFDKIENEILELFQNSENLTEKAWLLKCLAADPTKYGFVEEQLRRGELVIKTYAMETLTLMVKHENFEKARAESEANGIGLDDEFLRIFKTGIQSGDIAAVSLSATMFKDTDLGYKYKVEDFGFIEKALEEAQSPDMAEAKNELISTLAYLTGKDYTLNPSPLYNHPIDWERVMNIEPKQLVGIATSKGDIIVQLKVNWCPGTVSAFLELVESGYYDNRMIHRVVPNFVAQDGCSRGDGWGGPPFTIRSEFTPAPFLEGTFGMASAGKDTEGSQWYFTHTATPHLDGKYSNFGMVVSGIEVVHQLEVGDIIKKIVVIREQENR